MTCAGLPRPGSDVQHNTGPGGRRTFGSADTHDRLEHDGHRKDLAKLMGKLDGVLSARCVEGRVEVCLAGGVVRQAR